MALIIFWTAGNSGQFSAVAGYWGNQRGWAYFNWFWLFGLGLVWVCLGLVWVVRAGFDLGLVWFKWIWATVVNLQQLQGTGGISVGGHLAIGASKKSNGWGIEPALALCHPLLHISDANYNIWGHKYTNTLIQILIHTNTRSLIGEGSRRPRPSAIPCLFLHISPASNIWGHKCNGSRDKGS